MSKRACPDPPDDTRHPRIRTDPGPPAAAPAVPQARERAITEPRPQQPSAAAADSNNQKRVPGIQNKAKTNGTTYRHPFGSTANTPGSRAPSQAPTNGGASSGIPQRPAAFQRAASQAPRANGQTNAPVGHLPTPGGVPKNLPAPTAVPKYMSQAMNDLKDLKDEVSVLKNTIGQHTEQFEAIELTLANLQESAEKAARDMDGLHEAVTILFDRLEACEKRTGAAPAQGEEEEDEPKQRNNQLSYQGTLNYIFREAIRMEKGDAPPDPPEDGLYWLQVDKEERLLRPQWHKGWKYNKQAWVKELTLVFYDRGWKVGPCDMSQEEVLATTQAQIVSALQQIFNHHARKYKDAQKADDSKERKAQLARRRERKKAKANERSRIRRYLPKRYQKRKYDCAFHPAMQSSDESCEEPAATAIDAHTEDEAVAAPNAHAARTRAAKNNAPGTSQTANAGAPASTVEMITVWRRCPPLYRSRSFQECIDRANEKAEEERAKAAKKNKGNAKFTPRLQGEPKDTPLPNPSSYKKMPKIRLSLIDSEWLKTHPKFNTTHYFDLDSPGDQTPDASTSQGNGAPDPPEDEFTLDPNIDPRLQGVGPDDEHAWEADGEENDEEQGLYEPADA
ncbi:hypothetical protein EIP86_003066 [Pleurotus ostreatoroseus]|nr:hypothetical protein EIP86_003066 [Pleurotus ostreatoroseus]